MFPVAGARTIVVSSMYEERLYGERALRAGAEGYMNKQEPARTIINAMHQVLQGKLYFREELTNRVLQRARDGGTSLETSPIDALSDRELEVFCFIGQGLTSNEVAKRMHVSSRSRRTLPRTARSKVQKCERSRPTNTDGPRACPSPRIACARRVSLGRVGTSPRAAPLPHGGDLRFRVGAVRWSQSTPPFAPDRALHLEPPAEGWQVGNRDSTIDCQAD